MRRDSLILHDDGHEEKVWGRHHRLDLRSQVAKHSLPLRRLTQTTFMALRSSWKDGAHGLRGKNANRGDFLPFPAKAVLSHESGSRFGVSRGPARHPIHADTAEDASPAVVKNRLNSMRLFLSSAEKTTSVHCPGPREDGALVPASGRRQPPSRRLPIRGRG